MADNFARSEEGQKENELQNREAMEENSLGKEISFADEVDTDEPKGSSQEKNQESRSPKNNLCAKSIGIVQSKSVRKESAPEQTDQGNSNHQEGANANKMSKRSSI